MLHTYVCMSGLFNINFDPDDGWSVLLVGASNAFNSPNSTGMLLHAYILWPFAFGPFLILIMHIMNVYACHWDFVLPLIHSLCDPA